MSLNDLENLNALSSDSEEDEDVYIPIPFRFHDLAQRDEFELLREEIQKNNKREYNPKEVQLSLDQEDNLGFTPLHIAIMRGNLDTIRVCLENEVKLTLMTEGIPYSIFLLLVAATRNVFEENLFDVLKMLVIPDNMDTMKDRLGRTIAHVSASYNMIQILGPILEEWPSLLESVDNEGNSILLSACKGNSADVVSFLMDTYPQLASIQNHMQQNALHVSLESNALEVYQLLVRYHCPELDVRATDQFGRIPIDTWKHVMEEKREKGCSEFPHLAKKPLVLVTDPFTQHQTCMDPPPRSEKVLPPEQIQRCRVLVAEELGGCLLNRNLKERIEMEMETRVAPLSSILRVHDFNYVMKIMKACSKKTVSGFNNLDIDTVVSAESLIQARRAVQTVLTAVDRIANTTAESGPSSIFCCIRPPGHHIGINGSVNNPNNSNVSQGFCLFNNVAIAAAYARATYSRFGRIAIIDFDIHHGNGTEDCIQHLCPIEHDSTTVLQNMTLKFSNYSYKPWKDENDGENVFFASVHGFGKLANNIDYFYPGSGNTQNKVQYVAETETGVSFSKPEIIDVYVTKEQGKYAYFWREQFRANILPRLLEFHPDLIFISAGFDGHANDSLNNGFGGLSESDFAWATGEIVKIANTVCEGRIVSVLEGGYDVLGGCASPLAQSVLAHVEALCSHHYEVCDPAIWKMESEIEKKRYEEDASLKGEPVMNLMNPEQAIEETLSEEGSFDFDAISEEEEGISNPKELTEKPSSPVESAPIESPQLEEEEDCSDDMAIDDMPEIEAGEMDKIVDPLANEGGRKRQHKKVDYVALEAQLRKEEEEMRKKQKKEFHVC